MKFLRMDMSMENIQSKSLLRGFYFLCIDFGMAIGLVAAVLAAFAVDRSIPQKVELVFILDQRPVMRDLISGMKSNAAEKASVLKKTGAECRFAVIPFGANRNRVPDVPLTDNLEEFTKLLLAPPEDEFSGSAASAAEALDLAMKLDFRKNAQVMFFLISKSPFEKAAEVEGATKQMSERGITAIVQADAADADRCGPFIQIGRFYSMEGDDLTNTLAKSGKYRKNSARASNLLAQVAPGKQSGSSQIDKVEGIYSIRTDPNRRQLVAKLGGTSESEYSVQGGLEWLARHQANDGHWSDEMKCESDRRCSNLKFGAEFAETGLPILAFQAGGHYYFNDQEYSYNVKRGLDWLVRKQQSNGQLFSGPHTWYQHGIATFALAEACAVARANHKTPHPSYLDAARRAIKYMEDNQYKSGGWRYELNTTGVADTSVSGWQVLALKSALEAKIDVNDETMTRVGNYFEQCGDPSTGVTGYYGRGGGSDLTTSVGLIVQEFIVKKPNSPLATKAIGLLQDRAIGGIGKTGDFYTLYNGTLGMFLARGNAWQDWNRNVRDEVVNRQEKNGCARGSWSCHPHRHGNYYRTLDTAWAVLTLEVYYRYAADKQDGEKTGATH